MAKLKGTSLEVHDMEEDTLQSFSPENSPGMRARLEAISKHPRGRALDEFGREVPDPTPMAPPIGYKPSQSIADLVRQAVQSEALKFYAEQQGADTFEEADDFGLDEEEPDEFDTRNAPWEQQFDPLPPGELSRRRQAEYVKQRQSELNPDGARELVPPVRDAVGAVARAPEASPEPVERPIPPSGPAGPAKA